MWKPNIFYLKVFLITDSGLNLKRKHYMRFRKELTVVRIQAYPKVWLHLRKAEQIIILMQNDDIEEFKILFINL